RASTGGVITSSASAVQSSIGSETNVGPDGGSDAMCTARASAGTTSCARAGSWLHFTYGCGTRVAFVCVGFVWSVLCARLLCAAVARRGLVVACVVDLAPLASPRRRRVRIHTC